MDAFDRDDLQILGANMAGCLVVYLLLSVVLKGYDHSWFLTLYSSTVTSFVGLYFLHNVFQNGLLETIMHETEVSRFIAIFFVGYCIMDLLIGSFRYENLITYDDGWVHHFLYIGVLAWLLVNNLTTLFCVALLEEIPIVFLGIFEVQRKKRPSIVFGVLYFIFRICFHTHLIYTAAPISRLVFGSGVVLLAWHTKVFRSWVCGYLTRSRDRTRMSVHQKFALFGVLLLVNLLGHGSEVYQRVAAATGTSSVVMHLLIFGYFLLQAIFIIQDIYTENFIMTAISKKTIIYNISWEDPAVELEPTCLNMTSEDVVLTISSAGCNVLDYVVHGPKKIIAVDMNKAQLHVLELKCVCIRKLKWEQFFAIWAKSDWKVFQSVYTSLLRDSLTEETREFWDENQHLIKDNFMFAGSSGLMAKLLCLPLKLSGVSKRMHEGLGPPKGGGFGGFLFNMVLKLCSIPYLWTWFAPLGGVPLEQLNLLSRRPQVFVDRLVEVLTTRIWAAGNYFYYGYIVGEFSEECCPRYLKKENFKKLQERVDIVDIFYGTWAQAAEREGPGSITCASLLDSMDWMPPGMIAENMSKVVANMHPTKGRIFWRSFADGVHSPVLAHLNPVLVPTYDRVGWYLTQYLAPCSKAYDPQQLVCKGSDWKPSNSFLDDLMVMVIMAMYGMSSKEKDVRAFYKSQGSRYDGFREALLPGRDVFMAYVCPWVLKPKTWISVGCGTARDLEFVVEHVQTSGTKVYLVDLSDALLDMARERVQRLGLTSQVVLVEGDITSQEILKKLPKEVDLVTCSYCLTMIPPWKEALVSMKNMLKKGGHLCLIDFTTMEGQENRWDQKLNKWWFAHDGVWFNHKHVDWLKENLETIWYGEEEARVPYTFLTPTHYTFCGRKQ
ncbi:hypothetical protein CYMTET_40524 [Cymbomonas tetramitiformis]|uniref:Uncharacterized protein n=1 Tax=Cymbomonas tetramitiformis TaxID=36881 RepID=A0AAE0C7Z0_9CHLO|nr:hypothetical protein CYMTET_40524 [Cymbomonas tetramitiformis]